MKKIKSLAVSFLAIYPVFVFAKGSTFRSISEKLYNDVFLWIINILFFLSILFFAYSVLRFLLSSGDKKDQAKDTLLWGAIALFVIFSLTGILGLLNNTFFGDVSVKDGSAFMEDFNDREYYNPDLGGNIVSPR